MAVTVHNTDGTYFKYDKATGWKFNAHSEHLNITDVEGNVLATHARDSWASVQDHDEDAE